jgi:hypothetical protein
MEWFADFARVTFAGIGTIFDVSSVFCEFYIGGQFIQIKITKANGISLFGERV